MRREGEEEENTKNNIKNGNKLPSYYDDPVDLFYKKYIDIKDNIDNENNRKQISKLEIQYEFDHKEEKYKNDQLLSNEKLIPDVHWKSSVLTLVEFKENSQP